jgi:hypothetical protein
LNAGLLQTDRHAETLERTLKLVRTARVSLPVLLLADCFVDRHMIRFCPIGKQEN